MKITAIVPHLHTGHYSDLAFVEVQTDDPEISGWGECTLPGKPHAVAGAVRDAARLIDGADISSIRAIWERVYRHSYWRGGSVETSALSGVDMALWDIHGRLAGKPVHALLGGAVRQSFGVYANCGLSFDPEELARRARQAVADGFKIVKFYPLPPTPALPPARFVAGVYDCCAAVRAAIGNDCDFAIDLHGRPLPHTVIAIERAIRDLRPLWIEEPVPTEDQEALPRIRSQFSTPIALGERLFSRWQFQHVLQRGLVDIIQPDVGNAGGLSELRVIADMAEAYSVAFNPHSPNGVLHTAASLHIAAVAQTFGALEYRPVHAERLSVFGGEEIRLGADGTFSLSQQPGLGVTVNPENLRFDEAAVPKLVEWGRDGTPLEW